MKYPTWGGARPGAGRKPRLGTRVSHLARPEFEKRFPLHVTLRMRRDLPRMRSRRCFAALERAFWAGGDKFGMRLVHFAVMDDHIHLIVEAQGKQSLSSGMQGLGIRIARALNRTMKRRGAVLADHYHASIIKTPRHMNNVRGYVIHNAKHHYNQSGQDPFAPAHPLHAPHTWLLRRAAAQERSQVRTAPA